MDIYLEQYFNASLSESKIQLLEKIKLKEQLNLYDSIYIDFIENTKEYNEDTIIPKLDLIVKLFSLTLYYRNDILDCDETVENISELGINWLISLMIKEDFSTNSFMKVIFQMASITDKKVKFDENKEPIILMFYDSFDTYDGCKISNSTLNRYFYCPLIGKAGSLKFHSISNMIFSSLIDKGYSKIPLSLKTHCNKNDRSPHGNNVILSIDMLTHDYAHSKGIISYLSIYDITKLKTYYESINHDINSFTYRIFSVLIWYFYFEYSNIRRLNPGDFYGNNDTFKKIFDPNFMFIDSKDIKYVISYLFNSKDFPEELLYLKDDFNNLEKFGFFSDALNILNILVKV